MRRAFLALAAAMMIFPLSSFASRVAQFEGWYEILSEANQAPPQKEYFLFDADPLGVLWERYAQRPLPPDLEQYRNEPSILTGFTNRELIFLTFERAALIGNNYLVIQGGNGERLELKRRDDGKFDMATKVDNEITVYLLDTPTPTPDSD